MRNWKTLGTTLLLGGVLATAAACGGGGETKAGGASSGASSGGGAGSIDITLSEWAVKASAAKAAPGSVTFKVANKGATPHELAVVQLSGSAASDKIPQAAGIADEKQVKLIGRTASLDGGKSESKTVELPAGKYALICNLPAHYSQGMHMAFTVE